MTKCLNCGKIIGDLFEVCSLQCAVEYFEYVFGEKLEDHPEFKVRIQDQEKKGFQWDFIEFLAKDHPIQTDNQETRALQNVCRNLLKLRDKVEKRDGNSQ